MFRLKPAPVPEGELERIEGLFHEYQKHLHYDVDIYAWEDWAIANLDRAPPDIHWPKPPVTIDVEPEPDHRREVILKKLLSPLPAAAIGGGPHE